MNRTDQESIEAPKRLSEAEDKIVGILSEAKLTAVESVGLLEGVKAVIMRTYR